MGFLGGSDGKEFVWNAGHMGSIPESGRSPGKWNGYPLQYSCLEKYMGRGAQQATVHGVTKNWTLLRNQHFGPIEAPGLHLLLPNGSFLVLKHLLIRTQPKTRGGLLQISRISLGVQQSHLLTAFSSVDCSCVDSSPFWTLFSSCSMVKKFPQNSKWRN